MKKSYGLVLAVCLMALLATTAVANSRDNVTLPDGWTIENLTPAEYPGGRAVYRLSYDFSAGPISYGPYPSLHTVFNDEGILPGGAFVTGMGWDDLTLTVYHNSGASFANWASEGVLGWSYMDPVYGLNYTGYRPFFGVNQGPGFFGPVTNYYTYDDPSQYPLPTQDPFTFVSWATYNDGSGMPAGTWTGGIMYVDVESDIVSSDAASLTAVKSLFQ